MYRICNNICNKRIPEIFGGFGKIVISSQSVSVFGISGGGIYPAIPEIDDVR